MDAQLNAQRPDETRSERADRNFGDLLQELRVTQTGVQILFAFLLSLPFQNRFTELDRFQRGVWTTALLLSAAATVCLIAPVAYHRALFAHRKKPQLVQVGARFAVSGLALLGTAVCCAADLVLDLVLGRSVAIGVTLALAALLALTWLALPLRQRALTSTGVPATAEVGTGEGTDSGPGTDH